MKFNPGEYRRTIGGATYLKDTAITQTVPTPSSESHSIEETEESIIEPIEDIKPETNDTIRPEQVEEKPAPKRTRTNKRKPSNSVSGSNR